MRHYTSDNNIFISIPPIKHYQLGSSASGVTSCLTILRDQAKYFVVHLIASTGTIEFEIASAK